MYYTTLKRIRDNSPCTDGWEKLLKSLNKNKADDESLSLLYILNSNRIKDAIWGLRAIDDCPEIRLFAIRGVRQVQHFLKDKRSLEVLDITERYAVGEATVEELKAAQAIMRVVISDARAACAAMSNLELDTSYDTRAANAAASAAASAVDATTCNLASDAAEETMHAVKRAIAWDFTKNTRKFIPMELAYASQKEDFIAIFCQE